MSGTIERQRGAGNTGKTPAKTATQAEVTPTGGAAVTGAEPRIKPAGDTALNAQRGASTTFGLPAATPVAPTKIPPYSETFAGQSYVKDGSNAQFLGLMSKAVAANPELANGPLGQGLGKGEVGPQQVKALQSFLQSKGFSVGSKGVDGKFGPDTHAALAGLLNGDKPTAEPKAEPADTGTKPVDKKPDEQPTKADANSKTAVYDVSSATVTLPDGTVLEAHSGRGTAQDDPNSSNQRNRGTTPVGTYKLTMREGLFHGTAALRLTPISGNQHGRDGFLAHRYMLGPKGESHGCVVFKNYPAFMKAYQSGQINQIKIVE